MKAAEILVIPDKDSNEIFNNRKNSRFVLKSNHVLQKLITQEEEKKSESLIRRRGTEQPDIRLPLVNMKDKKLLPSQ